MILRSCAARCPSVPWTRAARSGKETRALGVLVCFLLTASLAIVLQVPRAPAPVRPTRVDDIGTPRTERMPIDAGATLADELADARGAGWWSDRKKRFQELAICALSSANVTYILVAGFTGPGAVIGFLVSAVGVAVCL